MENEEHSEKIMMFTHSEKPLWVDMRRVLLCVQAVAYPLVGFQALSMEGKDQPILMFEQFISSPPVIERLSWKKTMVHDLATGLSQKPQKEGHDGVSYFFARWQSDGLFLKSGPEAAVTPSGKGSGVEIDIRFQGDFWIIDPTGFMTHWQDPFASVRETRVQPSRVFRHRAEDFCELMNMGVMYLQPGALKWQRDSFSTTGYIPELGDEVKIAGHLRSDSTERADTMEVQYHTRWANYHYLLRYSYSTNVGLSFLPSTIESILVRPEGQAKLMELHLLSIQTSSIKLPPSLFRPELSKPTTPVVYYTNGSWYITNILGRLAPIPGPVSATGSLQSQRQGLEGNQIYYGLVIANTIVTFSLVRRMRKKNKNQRKEITSYA